MGASNNYHKKRLELSDALNEFKKQIEVLVKDLENYKLNPKANEKYIYFKNQQILSLKSILETFNDFQDTSNGQILSYEKEIGKLNNKVFKLEAVCLYHGITDLDYFMRMTNDVIISNVKRCYDENWRQTPFEIRHSDFEKTTRFQITHNPTVPYSDLIKKALEK